MTGEEFKAHSCSICLQCCSQYSLIVDLLKTLHSIRQLCEKSLGLFEMSKICAESITGDQREMHAG